MARRKKEIRSTHEDLLRYILGPDYEVYSGSGGPPAPEEPEAPHSGARGGRAGLGGGAAIRFRVRGKRARLALASTACLMASTALMLALWPQSLFLTGLVPSPPGLGPISLSGQGSPTRIASGGLRLELEGPASPEWKDGDYRYVLGYAIENSTEEYLYPSIVVVLLDAGGREIDSLPFSTPRGVLSPGQEVAGSLYWSRTAAQGATGYAVRLTAGEGTETDTLAEPGTDSDPAPAGPSLAEPAASP